MRFDLDVVSNCDPLSVEDGDRSEDVPGRGGEVVLSSCIRDWFDACNVVLLAAFAEAVFNIAFAADCGIYIPDVGRSLRLPTGTSCSPSSFSSAPVAESTFTRGCF